MIPNIDYTLDNNYKKPLKIKRMDLYKRVWFGLKQTTFEYIKAKFIFPLLYGKFTNSYVAQSVEEKNYVDNGISKIDGSKYIEKILKKISSEMDIDVFTIDTGGDPRFKIRVKRDAYPQLFDIIDNVLEVSGTKNLARAQLNRKRLRLEEFYLFIQDTSEGWRDEVPELSSGQRSKTRYMHVDSTPPNSVAKFIFYLNDVTKLNGAFEYVPKSHKAEKGLRSFIRRVIHHARIQGMDDDARSYFANLPKFLQLKAEFGNDINNENWELLPQLMDGPKGSIVLFDNSGIHRGGLISKGRRISIHGGFR